MTNVITILIILLVLGSAVFYIYRSKKRGDACIGCPHAKQCSGKCGGCSCGGKEK